MSKDLLEQAKNEYLETPVPEYIKHNGWPDLRVKLGNRGYDWMGLILGRALAFAAFGLFLTGAVVVSAQTAKPGNGLYTVKVLADKVYARATGNYEMAIQRRADEVINSAGSPSQGGIESAKKEYQNVLEEARKNVKDSESQDDFEKTLDDQEEKFKQELEKGSENEEHLNEVIRETEDSRSRVKGEKSEGIDRNQEDKQGERGKD